jgi:hypothetical protein
MKLSEMRELFKSGKPIEVKSGVQWHEMKEDVEYSLLLDKDDYRVKPETKPRPWTAEEVPMLAWYRRKGYPDEWMTLAGLSGYGKGVKLSLGTGWIQAFEDLEHSTDGGKTWLLCGTETTE